MTKEMANKITNHERRCARNLPVPQLGADRSLISSFSIDYVIHATDADATSATRRRSDSIWY